MHWTWTTVLLTTAIVTMGGLLQAVTGLGAGLLVVPLLALISVALVPGPIIFASLALSVSMALAGRRHIDFPSARPIVAGLLIGTIGASVYISRLPLDALGVVFGTVILIAIVISLRGPVLALDTRGNVAAGMVSGFMGTSAGVGAPVLALVFQHYPGDRLRATLAFLYAVSAVTMLVFLHLAGRFATQEVISGLILMPGFLIGYACSPRLVKRIDRGHARTAVLGVSIVSACLLIARSVSVLMTR
jgi:uncharacterized membrane protein YfcA